MYEVTLPITYGVDAHYPATDTLESAIADITAGLDSVTSQITGGDDNGWPEVKFTSASREDLQVVLGAYGDDGAYADEIREVV